MVARMNIVEGFMTMIYNQPTQSVPWDTPVNTLPEDSLLLGVSPNQFGALFQIWHAVISLTVCEILMVMLDGTELFPQFNQLGKSVFHSGMLLDPAKYNVRKSYGHSRSNFRSSDLSVN